MKLRVLLVVCLIVLGGYAGNQVPPASDAQNSGPYRISVNVDLVVLHPTVRDRKGRFVSNLGQESFVVYEDGVRQSIQLFRRDDIPVTVGMVVDHSGSMGPKISDVVAGAQVFVQSSKPEDEMFVVNFNERVSLGLPAGVQFTNSSSELGRAISEVPTTGQTALYDAVGEALAHLQSGSRDKKVLIVISDGGDNASSRSLAQVMKMAGQSSALVYTIGIFDADNPDRNPGVLRRLARETGGEAFFPSQRNEVIAVCRRIAQDIRNQYVIGYVSSNTTPDGAYRAIRVLARPTGHGRLVVRARAGYVAGGEPRHGKGDDAK